MLLLGAASCSGCCCFCVVTRNLPMAAYLPPAPSDIFVPEVAEKRINPRKVSHLPQVTIITGGIGLSEVFPSKSAPQRLGGPPNASTEYNGLHKNTRRDCKRKNTFAGRELIKVFRFLRRGDTSHQHQADSSQRHSLLHEGDDERLPRVDQSGRRGPLALWTALTLPFFNFDRARATRPHGAKTPLCVWHRSSATPEQLGRK